MDKGNLQRWVTAAQQGDAEAFGCLYESCYRSLYKTAYYILGNAADAEDTVMDTVADAYAGVKELRNPEAFEGWLYKILWNKARKKRGLMYYQGAVELPETLESRDSTEKNASDKADLMRALDSLDDGERMIVTLSAVEGYTSAEISKIMSLNANTVRSKQMRAFAKMRTLLAVTVAQ